jgi:SpoVK/Ycf46/Vps4 family AAA+-type ATPase
MLAINSSTVISKWVGESASQIRKIFDRYRAHVKHYGTYPVILLNEADQILGKKTEISSSSDQEFNSIQGALLECTEGLLTEGGLLLATTNTKGHLDEAFGRRFTDIIEFTGLDTKEQIGLWQALLPEVLNEYQAEYLLDVLGSMEPGYIQNIVSKYHRYRFLRRGSSKPLDLLIELGLNARGLNAA